MGSYSVYVDHHHLITTQLGSWYSFYCPAERVCKFILVINSNLSPPFQRLIFAGFLLKTATPPLFHQRFEDVFLGLDWRCWGSNEQRLKANYSCSYFWSNPAYVTMVAQRYRQTNGWTDNISEALHSALCASHSNKNQVCACACRWHGKCTATDRAAARAESKQKCCQ